MLTACGTAGSLAARPSTRVSSGIVPLPSPQTPTPPPTKITYPANGHRKWIIAPTGSATVGTAGRVLRYRVEIESDIKGVSPTGFARTITTTLADRRGWTAGGAWRFRQVGAGETYDTTVYLATPDTRDKLCEDTPDGYTSCRNGTRVVLNVARWVKGVPDYGAPLAVYRTYMINHEMGHRLGWGHQLCPGAGRPAPVMQQQTLGLHGCDANPWPYPHGILYAGRFGVYADKPPARDRGSK
ncbi:DUF3152 domain-containing protein [Actinoplanes sp. TBRC 11911]|uniref:DUF3152 domain-containing protein n=1 Tax=Actinoplanes sp. TBRC 11911 TaxID=2729386 RepID=UPI001B7D56DC|nr:DUF3152 domain-containing protein [Actinoplanes sp. TBRC 11911]